MATIYDPQDDKKTQEGTSQPLQTIGTASPQPSSAMASPEKRPQGSGRFTNLQKYLTANEGAGQRIAGRVGQQVQGDIQQKQQQAQDYYSKLGQSVSQAQQTAQTGAGYAQQLKNIGQSIQGAQYQAPTEGQIQQGPLRQEQGLDAITAFTSDPNQFKQFQDIQSGRAINEDLLRLQQQKAMRGAGEFAGQVQGAQEALGSEQGRFDLLRQTFGGAARPGYTTGQQRLDQLFLTRGGLGDIRRDVNEQARIAQQLGKDVSQSAQNVANITAQEQGLLGDIRSQAEANEQAYLDMLSSYIDPTNIGREQEWESLQTAVSAYKPSDVPQTAGEPVNTGFTADQMAALGVDATQGVYNVFDNIVDASDIAARGRAATGYQDIASQADVDRYSALSQILGMTPEEQRLTQASDLGAAFTAKEGVEGLASRLEAADKAFREQAAKDLVNRYSDITHYGSRDPERWYGSYDTSWGYNRNPGDYIFSSPVSSIREGTGLDLLERGRAGMDVTAGIGKAGPEEWKRATARHGYNSAGISSTPEELAAASARAMQWGSGRRNINNQRFEDVYESRITGEQQRSEQQIVDAFKRLLDEQNYNRTLGGRRTTFLDEEAGGDASTEKYGSQLPVTGTSGTGGKFQG